MHSLLIILLLFPAAAAAAADQAAPAGLSLERAVVNVLERNPALKAAGYEYSAAAARIRAAKLTPAPRAAIELENFGGSGVLSGSDSLETTLSLSTVLELGKKSRLRGDVAANEAIVLRNEQDAERLDLLADTARRFVQVVHDQERLAIAEETHALAEQTEQAVDRRVKAGKSATVELRRARIARAKTALEIEHASHMLESSRVKLASLWGTTIPGFSEARADLYAVSEPAPFETLVRLLENNPDLVRLVSEKRLAETRIQLARARRSADIEIGGGIRHFNALDDTGLVVSLDIPFGNRSRARPAIEEAEWLQLSNPQRLEQQRLELHTMLFEVHQEIRHQIQAVAALRDTIIPLAEQALRDYEQGYAAGRYSLLELNVAQHTLLDSRLELLKAAADYHHYRIELDRLTGAGLTTGATP